ncbi:MAG TPA: NmrA family NAD(P)-binding protein [Candidatus Krumholzibacteria bacterium]|nr:NmrA family NAD(P)-binding protein [Candidatus Krumholzibacteria bacterium]
MRHLILGGTGNVGGAVVTELIGRGEREVSVLTRSPEKAEKLPRGVRVVEGNLANPATFDDAFRDFDTMFLLNVVSPDELQEGLMALAEARRTKTKRIVYLSVQQPSPTGYLVPHFAAKLAIHRALEESGIPFTIIGPNNFYQNDFWFKDAILEHGIYPQPIGEIGLSRVDVRDIAVASANALTQPGHDGKYYALVGPDALSGEDCAKIWSEATGRTVKYAGNDLDAWEKQSLAYMPAWAVYDFRLMYEMFQAEGWKASKAQLKECETIVGHKPRSYRDFVRETAAAWK